MASNYNSRAENTKKDNITQYPLEPLGLNGLKKRTSPNLLGYQAFDQPIAEPVIIILIDFLWSIALSFGMYAICLLV